jgi:hypothetical protein
MNNAKLSYWEALSSPFTAPALAVSPSLPPQHSMTGPAVASSPVCLVSRVLLRERASEFGPLSNSSQTACTSQQATYACEHRGEGRDSHAPDLAIVPTVSIRRRRLSPSLQECCSLSTRQVCLRSWGQGSRGTDLIGPLHSRRS